ncbi:molybdenum cofactor guanylyltransferase [Acinetobacter lactucae]|uniref:molybdenum cofactor guanylyltransferase n=1 Tax=Acinetobacter lactucae TaxID=1785128 RepID=UPI0015806EDC|nr:NTP transferase domain-containing protein [Acinetobacter lactucae]NUF15449.1 NTP transferase domain-containing protein [Acinetobacter lactucae]NUF37833.1 NTP transferase domain-containing protein [Acinetobacter lactucae]NUG51307.1 NTP transferase domain-containing protein [Acinetobacter lactucae]
MNKGYPVTDLVILAGGQARRMNGLNKLLQQFDGEPQLLKIHQKLRSSVSEVWVNSHRDYSIYQSIVPDIRCYQDDVGGFLGPLMGMKSAWSNVEADYILFIPCDVTYIPTQVVAKLHGALRKNKQAQAAYVSINGDVLYPFCLLKRESLITITKQIEKQRLSLKECFKLLHAQTAIFQKQNLFFHSINSLDELQQYKQLISF